MSTSVVRYPRYLDTYRRYLRDDTSIANRQSHDIPRYIVAVKNIVRRRKYREYRRYHASRTTGQRAAGKRTMPK